jgi:hypothetical protein
MKRTIWGGLLAAAGVAGAALFSSWVPAAHSQVRANPSYLPMGTSASGTASVAWFHDSSSGRAIACQTVGSASAGLTGIQCVSAKLPPPDTP